MSDGKDGVYCKVCGGVIPQDASIGTIMVAGKPTGISRLDFILDEVAALNLQSRTDISTELLKRAKALNYIPTKMTDAYAGALLQAYLDRCEKKEK